MMQCDAASLIHENTGGVVLGGGGLSTTVALIAN